MSYYNIYHFFMMNDRSCYYDEDRRKMIIKYIINIIIYQHDVVKRTDHTKIYEGIRMVEIVVTSIDLRGF